jgi:hypothetical protein
MVYLQSLASVQEPQNSDALHHTGSGVAEELASRLQCAINADVVFGGHEEVARLGRVMRRLLGDVVASGAIWIVPVAREDLAQDWIKGLLDASAIVLVTAHGFYVEVSGRIRRLDVPPAQVELGDGYEALDRVVDLGQRKEGLGVSHEAVRPSATTWQRVERKDAVLLRDALQHRPWLEDEGRQRNSAQVGTGTQLCYDVREHCDTI